MDSNQYTEPVGNRGRVSRNTYANWRDRLLYPKKRKRGDMICSERVNNDRKRLRMLQPVGLVACIDARLHSARLARWQSLQFLLVSIPPLH